MNGVPEYGTSNSSTIQVQIFSSGGLPRHVAAGAGHRVRAPRSGPGAGQSLYGVDWTAEPSFTSSQAANESSPSDLIGQRPALRARTARAGTSPRSSRCSARSAASATGGPGRARPGPLLVRRSSVGAAGRMASRASRRRGLAAARRRPGLPARTPAAAGPRRRRPPTPVCRASAPAGGRSALPPTRQLFRRERSVPWPLGEGPPRRRRAFVGRGRAGVHACAIRRIPLLLPCVIVLALAAGCGGRLARPSRRRSDHHEHRAGLRRRRRRHAAPRCAARASPIPRPASTRS